MRNLLTFLSMLVALGSPQTGWPQSNGPKGENPAPGPALSALQQQLFRDYERFEKSLYDVAEQARRKDPERSELLYRARSQSQEQRILADMQSIAELLTPQGAADGSSSVRYGPAADRQKELLARLNTVLKLLQSLDERARLDAEIKRLEELLKDTTQLIARQKDVRADTQRGSNTGKLKDAQERVADQAEKLGEKIDSQDRQRQEEEDAQRARPEESDREPKESEQETPEPGDSTESGESGDSSESESPPSEQAPDSKQSESPQGEQSPPPESPPPNGQQPPHAQPSPQQPSQQQPPQSQQSQQSQESQQSPQTPGREQLEQARREMQQAIEKLEQEQKEGALEDQDDAVARLEEMKAELEEILRQLREEEKETYLTLLEARFQNMLQRQERINAETKRLEQIPQPDRLQHNHASQTDTIRKEQGDNIIEAEKAFHLLTEEGSSVAFPEAVEQMLKNMQVVERRLVNYDTGQTTQLVETLIVETLREMIEAFQQEIEKQQEQQQSPNQPQQGESQDPALVDSLAELRLIRSLQSQINRLTKQIGTEIEGEQATDADQLQLIDDLADRQQRIQDATYDLSVGRNR